MIGTSIAHYNITGKLGRGGMGEVYRATDTKLGREVAIKVLPDSFTNDQERLARFQREARVLASLNHPNIAAIYGIEELDGVTALVLELVEGKTLAERLRSELTIQEALDVGNQIAEALDAAHEKGIVHRDLKPENVKLCADGKVKVLDFGLAKTMVDDSIERIHGGDSPTITHHFTQPGAILGTAAYMSPEQARGNAVDKRSDIWSFGCVLFECFSGERAFKGDSATEVLGAVLHKEPDFAALPAATPPPVRRLLSRCLTKDKTSRLRDIGDARLELLDEPLESVEGDASKTWLTKRRLSTLISALVLLGLSLIVAAVLYPYPSRLSVEIPTVRLPIPLTAELQREFMGQTPRHLISLDGKKVVFSAENKLWVRRLDTGNEYPLPGTEGGISPFWSPDSEEIGFFHGNSIRRVDVSGDRGLEIASLDLELGTLTGAWMDDGQIYFSSGLFDRPLWQVSSSGGIVREVDGLGPNFGMGQLEPLPDNAGVLAVGYIPDRREYMIVIFDGERLHSIVPESNTPVLSPTYCRTSEHIIYEIGDDRSLWAVSFNLKQLATMGKPIRFGPGRRPSVSATGSLLHLLDPVVPSKQLVWVDRNGNIGEEVGRLAYSIKTPNISPTGRDVVYQTGDGKQSSIEVASLVELGLPRKQYTFSFWRTGWFPLWLPPDGSEILINEYYGGAKSITVDSGDARTLVHHAGRAVPQLTSVSSDGRWLAYAMLDTDTSSSSLWRLDLEKDELSPQPILPAKKGVRTFNPVISPNGKHIVFLMNRGGDSQLCLATFPEARSYQTISVKLKDVWGVFPAWHPQGKELYYVEDNSLMYVQLDWGRPSPIFPSAGKLFDGDAAQLELDEGFAVGANVDQFLAVQAKHQQGAQPQLIWVQNWYKAQR